MSLSATWTYIGGTKYRVTVNWDDEIDQREKTEVLMIDVNTPNDKNSLILAGWRVSPDGELPTHDLTKGLLHHLWNDMVNDSKRINKRQANKRHWSQGRLL
jgi:hypothetical protein